MTPAPNEPMEIIIKEITELVCHELASAGAVISVKLAIALAKLSRHANVTGILAAETLIPPVKVLRSAIECLRAHAEPSGPLHGYWDIIFDLEAIERTMKAAGK